MFNVIFYEDELTSTSSPAETNECYLSSLRNGKNLFYHNSAIGDFTAPLTSLVNGERMFYYCSNLSSFSSDLSSLTNGSYMFYNCDNLSTFSSDLSSLTNGYHMFYDCNSLRNSGTFDSDLSSLEDGRYMFYKCHFSKIDSDLSSLTNGSYMFYNCDNLSSFTSDLSSLTNGNNMFNGCIKLTTFTSDLSSLSIGQGMFNGCTKLTSFTSDLSSLTNGGSMFYKCKLDAPSVMYIIATLPQNTSNNSITIGIGVSSSKVNGKNTATQLLEFANEVGYETWAKLKQAFVDKKWSVTWQYGGTTSSITLSEDEQFRGIPVYAKLIEEDNKELAEYCTEDVTKYYNIEWGHDVTHPEEFEYFGSLLEACGYYGVIPKKYLEEI